MMNAHDDRKRKRPLVDSSNGYEGYKFDKLNPSIDRVDSSITANDFFQRYVSKRRPCILIHQNKIAISNQLICQVAGDAPVQVERRLDVTKIYGQNRSKEHQVNLTINEFWKYLENEKDRELYYLSTQESSDIFSTPCRQLLETGHIPERLDWAGSLILQSCNLWWGGSKESSSGLHHDFHDNFYVVQAGVKRFRLFPPSGNVPVFGEIDQIHPNGLISYRSNPTRADGVPLIAKRAKLKNDESSDEDEDQALIGKGFDYESDNSDDFNVDENGNDDYDDLVGNDESDNGNKDDDDDSDASEDVKMNAETGSTDSRPDHFSPCHPDDVAEPGITIEIHPGECLYLPCGWFHHVTSLSVSSDCHLALNYWYHPRTVWILLKIPICTETNCVQPKLVEWK